MPALTSDAHAPSYTSPCAYLHLPCPSLLPSDHSPSYLSCIQANLSEQLCHTSMNAAQIHRDLEILLLRNAPVGCRAHVKCVTSKRSINWYSSFQGPGTWSRLQSGRCQCHEDCCQPTLRHSCTRRACSMHPCRAGPQPSRRPGTLTHPPTHRCPTLPAHPPSTLLRHVA